MRISFRQGAVLGLSPRKSRRLNRVLFSCSCFLLEATGSGHTQQGGAWEKKEERQGVREEERPLSSEIQGLLHPWRMQICEGAPGSILHVSVPSLADCAQHTFCQSRGCSSLSLFLEFIILPSFFSIFRRKLGGGEIFLVSGRGSPPHGM